MQASIEMNMNALTEAGIPFEMIVVDWCSESQKLYQSVQLKEVLARPEVINIIVDKSVAVAEKLNPDLFYEFFAKNIAIRQASKDYILIVNSDLFISGGLAQEIKALIDQRKNNFFARAVIRHEIPFFDQHHPKQIIDLRQYNSPVMEGYSGDFLFLKRSDLIDIAEGYDESNQNHRSHHVRQASMDGEMLWKMYNKGMVLECLVNPYYHFKHDKGARESGEFYNTNGYVNVPNWGFIKYPRKILGNNVLEIYS